MNRQGSYWTQHARDGLRRIMQELHRAHLNNERVCVLYGKFETSDRIYERALILAEAIAQTCENCDSSATEVLCIDGLLLCENCRPPCVDCEGSANIKNDEGKWFCENCHSHRNLVF